MHSYTPELVTDDSARARSSGEASTMHRYAPLRCFSLQGMGGTLRAVATSARLAASE